MKNRLFAALLLFFTVLVFSQTSLASYRALGNYEFAQAEVDAYDPFIDYSEFDEAAEEEADINFFRHGRFFTIGFTGGMRMMTGEWQQFFQNSMTFGVFLSYFFDLRFAFQLGYQTGSNHTVSYQIPNSSTPTITGSASISAISLSLKYYLNTQNVTRGLAILNPYLVGGVSQVSRKSFIDGATNFGEDKATGFDVGLGIELPLMRRKMYLGLQGTYQLVNFPDEGTNAVLDTNEPLGIKLAGDFMNASVILGVNF